MKRKKKKRKRENLRESSFVVGILRISDGSPSDRQSNIYRDVEERTRDNGNEESAIVLAKSPTIARRPSLTFQSGGKGGEEGREYESMIEH